MDSREEQASAKRFGVGDVLMLVVSVAFLVGMCTVFGACGPKEDGTWMTCHWAGVSVTGLAAVLVAISVIHAVVPDPKTKAGVAAASIPVAVLAAMIPGNLIDLCMMQTMQCHAVMQPACLLMSVLMIAAAVADIVMRTRRASGRARRA